MPRRGATVARRGNVIDVTYAKRCNNTCPICWMPLNVGGGEKGKMWEEIQMVFKAKPVFSVKQNGIDYSRAVHVFGLNGFTGDKTTNYEACHFLHHVTVGNEQEFIGLWNAGAEVLKKSDEVLEDGEAVFESTHQITSMLGGEPALLPAFFQRFTRQDKIFQVFHDSASVTYGVLDELIPTNASFTFEKSQSFLKKLLSRRFPGCVDCNSKMTNLDFIEPLFATMFPNETYSPKRRSTNSGLTRSTTRTRPATRTPKTDGFSSEMMLHYIMLSGLLSLRNLTGTPAELVTKPYYKIIGFKQQNSWLLKCIMMWCSLQIIFCNWKMASLYSGVRHHSDYIYRGVEDFYLSLYFYSMYIIFAHDKYDRLEFEEFHYYYTSMMPLYYGTLQLNPYKGPYNLCSIVLGEDKIGTFTFPSDPGDRYDKIRDELCYIQERVASFWTYTMKSFCERLHTVTDFGVSPIPPYFTPSDWIRKHRTDVTRREVSLDIQTFCDLLTPRWYWFHFRYITLPNITKTSTEYLHTPSMPAAAMRMWYKWCRDFDASVQHLGVRFYMEQKAERIRLRMAM